MSGPSRRPRAFAVLWASDTLSVFGAEITMLALPLTAALVLHASASQMGALVAAELLPYALFSLPAGALVDRWPKLVLLRWAAFSRALLLATVPMAAWAGVLGFGWTLCVAFLLSCHSVFVDLAYQALFPQLVEPDALVRANARLGVSESAAGIAGPGLAGALVRLFGAPMALAADALALFAAGVMMCRIAVAERPPPPPPGETLRREIGEGLRFVWRQPLLRWVALTLAFWQLLKHAFVAVFVVFAVRELALPAERVGLAASAAGVGFLLASMSVQKWVDDVGIGPTLLAGLLATVLGWGAVAAVHGSAPASALGAAVALEGYGAGLFFLAFVSLRQAIAPPTWLARVVASIRFVSLGSAPLGALVGGWLGDAIGLRATLAGTALLGLGWVMVVAWRSPLSAQRRMPQRVAIEAV